MRHRTWFNRMARAIPGAPKVQTVTWYREDGTPWHSFNTLGENYWYDEQGNRLPEGQRLPSEPPNRTETNQS